MLFQTESTFKQISLLLILSLIGNSSYFCLPSHAAADSNDLNFKVYNPSENNSINSTETAEPNITETDSTTSSQKAAKPSFTEEKPVDDINQTMSQSDNAVKSTETSPDNNQDHISDNKPSDVKTDEISKSETTTSTEAEGKSKLLQGYVRVVPSGTKISIIMDTAVDSDTSQEGDEFSARTAEDLTIDGTTAVPAGSIIRGRIATLNAPKHLNRSGSVALKFDSVTTPDNRQIPLVANLVARGGVVHARRGLKDIAIDTGTFALPTAVALGIGAVAGHSSSSVGVGGGALIGAAVGAAIGVCILMAKKGKRVDVRPGDELKIELAEDLHMPSM